MTVTLAKPEPEISLKHIRWATYVALLEDAGEHRGARFAYYQGDLEIQMPSDRHEVINRLLARIVGVVTEALDLPLREFGSVTLNREDLAAGVEPDSCFYIKNALGIQGHGLDLQKDPPPDLVIEVDITRRSNLRFRSYHLLGIPEVWCYRSGRVTLYHRNAKDYGVVEQSILLPLITATQLTLWIEQSQSLETNALSKQIRQWIAAQQKLTDGLGDS